MQRLRCTVFQLRPVGGIRPTFRACCEGQLGRIPGKGELAKAMRYALRRWTALTLFLEDGRVAIDNNPAERAVGGSARSHGDGVDGPDAASVCQSAGCWNPLGRSRPP